MAATETWDEKLQKYGVIFEDGTATWSYYEKVGMYLGIAAAATTIGSVTGQTSWDAFRDAFSTSAEDPLRLERVSSGYCQNGTFDGGGCTQSSHHIQFGAILYNPSTPQSVVKWAAHNIVHELGHAIQADIPTWIPDPNNPNTKMKNPDHPVHQIPGTFYVDEGWPNYPGSRYWRMHPCANDPPGKCGGGEVWADMFLGWVYDTFAVDQAGLGNQRRQFMNETMSDLLAP
jgi:hypothetical protein